MIYAKVTFPMGAAYLKIDKLLDYKKTKFQEVAIADIPILGRTLLIDNKVQTCYREYKAYHDALVYEHKANEDPEECLILGAGEGVTVFKCANMGYKVTAVDIDKECIEMISKHLKSWNDGIYDHINKKFSMIFIDAMDYLKSLPDNQITYLIFDLTEPSKASQKCYSEEFIQEVHRVLKSGGIFSYQDGDAQIESILTPIVEKRFKNESSIIISSGWRFGHIFK